MGRSLSGCAAYLRDVAARGIDSKEADILGEDDDMVRVMTVHSAKGLEFKAVFVVQALEGVLPSAYAVGNDEDLDEELRLLYVAVTRAADHLFISCPMVQYRRFDGPYITEPSRFLQGVPEGLLEPWSLTEEVTGDAQLGQAGDDQLGPTGDAQLGQAGDAAPDSDRG